MNKIQKIIELYNKVQRIPYYCLTKRDPDLLLRKNKGSCSEKHLFLGKEFEKLGILVKYLLIKFDWRDLPIPKKIIQKTTTHPPHPPTRQRRAGPYSSIGYHLALKIKLNDKWVSVDATWDPKLKKAGFPITKNWGGKLDTKLAVKPIEIIEFKKAPPKQVKRLKNKKFYSDLNKWLEKQRKNKN